MKMHLLFLVAATVFCHSMSLATSFNIKPFSEFTQTTENVVRGTLSNIHTENAIMNDGGKTIYTMATVSIKEVLKGNIRGQTIQVRRLGGTKDGITLEIPSAPDFIENDDTVLFLGPEQENRSYEVSGLELGKFGLEEKNGATLLTGGLFAYSKPEEHPHPGESEHAPPSGDLTENQKPWSLSDLRALIKKQEAHPIAISSKATTTPTPALQPHTSPSVAASSENSFENIVKVNLPESTGNQIYYWIGGFFAILIAFYFLKRR